MTSRGAASTQEAISAVKAAPWREDVVNEREMRDILRKLCDQLDGRWASDQARQVGRKVVAPAVLGVTLGMGAVGMPGCGPVDGNADAAVEDARPVKDGGAREDAGATPAYAAPVDAGSPAGDAAISALYAAPVDAGSPAWDAGASALYAAPVDGGSPAWDGGASVLYAAPVDGGAASCWTDEECAPGDRCDGAITCPDGAICILPAAPGTCVPKTECMQDAECAQDEICVGEQNCPDGAYCILPSAPGTCEPLKPCEDQGECGPNETCRARNSCPPGAFCIMPPDPETFCFPDDE